MAVGNLRRTAGVLAALASCGPLTGAQASDQWKTILERQLDREKSCQVLRLTSVQIYELLGKTNIRADAHCVDGRVYTATRSGAIEKFRLNICPTKC
ncbi:MAG: hypothetical protein ACR2O4_16590 [Hyphomicrobiaceae bacterium]